MKAAMPIDNAWTTPYIGYHRYHKMITRKSFWRENKKQILVRIFLLTLLFVISLSSKYNGNVVTNNKKVVGIANVKGVNNNDNFDR